MKSIIQGAELVEQSDKWENDSQASVVAIREEADILQNTLQELANCIIDDTENTARMLNTTFGSKLDRSNMDDEESDNELSFSSPTRSRKSRQSTSPSRMARMRSMSPVRARSPAVADSVISAAQSALKKRQLQLQVRQIQN